MHGGKRIALLHEAVHRSHRRESGIIWPKARAVLEYKSVVTELGRHIRRELRDVGYGIFDLLQALGLRSEPGGSGLEYACIIVRFTQIMLHGTPVVIESVTIFFKYGQIKICRIRSLAGSGILLDPLIRKEHLHIDVRQDGCGNDTGPASAGAEQKHRESKRKICPGSQSHFLSQTGTE